MRCYAQIGFSGTSAIRIVFVLYITVGVHELHACSFVCAFIFYVRSFSYIAFTQKTAAGGKKKSEAGGAQAQPAGKKAKK